MSTGFAFSLNDESVQSNSSRRGRRLMSSRGAPFGTGSSEVSLRWLREFRGPYRSVVLLMTVSSLFVNDLRYAILEGAAFDYVFDIFIALSVLIFLFDIVVSTLLRPTYLWSFRFATDVVSFGANILDISSILDNGCQPYVLRIISPCLRELRAIRIILAIQRFLHSRDSTDDYSKSSQLGLARARKNRSERGLLDTLQGLLDVADGSAKPAREDTRVRKRLNGSNTVRIGVLILISSAVVSIVASQGDDVSSSEFWLDQLNSADNFASTLILSLDNLRTDLSELGWVVLSNSTTEIHLDIPGSLITTCGDLSSGRWILFGKDCPSRQYRRPIELSGMSNDRLSLILDKREEVKWFALMGLFRTLFVFLLALTSALVFERDCNLLILNPISRMISLMRRIQADPLCADELIELEQRRAVQRKIDLDKWQQIPAWRRLFLRRSRVPQTQSLDIESDHGRLEATMLKLGSLLKVGFGEAGAEAISAIVLNEGNSRFACKGIEAVFGYIDINHFTAITEILRERVVLLVNSVAEIIHGIIDEYNGFVCKNNAGESGGFFVIWKLDAGSRKRLCELAVVAVSKIIAAIEKSPTLRTYRDDPRLKLLNVSFSVRVTAALHHGRAVEGTVGSEFKLEASYVGRDVVLTQSLVALSFTRYKISTLLSGDLVEQLSVNFRESLLRQIDTILFDGRGQGIFSLDLDPSQLGIDNRTNGSSLNKFHINTVEALVTGFEVKQARSNRKRAVMGVVSYEPIREFKGFELALMRKTFEGKNGRLFIQLFNKAFLNFQCDEMGVARNTLARTATFWVPELHRKNVPLTVVKSGVIDGVGRDARADGPSIALLHRLEKKTYSSNSPKASRQ